MASKCFTFLIWKNISVFREFNLITKRSRWSSIKSILLNQIIKNFYIKYCELIIKQIKTSKLNKLKEKY